jgi:hypothetical protein
LENRRGKLQLVYLEISEKSALILIFKKEGVRMLTGFISLVIMDKRRNFMNAAELLNSIQGGAFTD